MDLSSVLEEVSRVVVLDSFDELLVHESFSY